MSRQYLFELPNPLYKTNNITIEITAITPPLSPADLLDDEVMVLSSAVSSLGPMKINITNVN